jgi:hypothetical protein
MPLTAAKPPQPPPSTPRRIDARVAVLSLVGAVVFWLLNALNKEGYSTKLAYPLQLAYNDSLYVPVTPLPRLIQANVSGNGWDLLRKTFDFAQRPVIYPIVNPLRTKFINTASLTDVLTERLPDVRVNYVVADTLDVAFERRRIKTVRLVADTTGLQLPRRFVVSTAINVVPQTVTFEGPESVLRTFPDTLRIPVRGAVRTDFDERLPVPYRRHPLVQATAEQVSVSFEIAELLSN